MPVFVIKTFPEAVLRRLCRPVSRIDKKTVQFVDKLIKTMKKQPGGVGIAAPQVGVATRIAIVDVRPKDPSAKQLILINPKIIKQAKKKTFREGCMSLPDFTANVTRWVEIEIESLGLDGNLYRHHARGIEAICVQHEIDHLNGMLFIDRVRSLKSDVFRRKRYL
jgi:peptide deformylase